MLKGWQYSRYIYPNVEMQTILLHLDNKELKKQAYKEKKRRKKKEREMQQKVSVSLFIKSVLIFRHSREAGWAPTEATDRNRQPEDSTESSQRSARIRPDT